MENNAERVKQLCLDFLDEKWVQNAKHIEVKPFASVCNQIFRVSLNNGAAKDVVIKFYGHPVTGKTSIYKSIGEAAEAVIVYCLSQIGFAPKILGVFNGGRIEEFVQGVIYEREAFTQRSLLSPIARKLARFHCLSMPISKEVKFPFDFLDSVRGIKMERSMELFAEDERDNVRKIFGFSLEAEYDWYIRYAAIISGGVVFSHNDFHPSNMIIKEGVELNADNLLFIDYEGCAYNYRGYDIGHFLQTLRYKAADQFGKAGFRRMDENDYEIERYFVEEYLNELQTLRPLNENVDNVDHLIMEASFFNQSILLKIIQMAAQHINEVGDEFKQYTFFADAVDNYNHQKAELVKRFDKVFLD